MLLSKHKLDAINRIFSDYKIVQPVDQSRIVKEKYDIENRIINRYNTYIPSRTIIQQPNLFSDYNNSLKMSTIQYQQRLRKPFRYDLHSLPQNPDDVRVIDIPTGLSTNIVQSNYPQPQIGQVMPQPQTVIPQPGEALENAPPIETETQPQPTEETPKVAAEPPQEPTAVPAVTPPVAVAPVAEAAPAEAPAQAAPAEAPAQAAPAEAPAQAAPAESPAQAAPAEAPAQAAPAEAPAQAAPAEAPAAEAPAKEAAPAEAPAAEAPAEAPAAQGKYSFPNNKVVDLPANYSTDSEEQNNAITILNEDLSAFETQIDKPELKVYSKLTKVTDMSGKEWDTAMMYVDATIDKPAAAVTERLYDPDLPEKIGEKKGETISTQETGTEKTVEAHNIIKMPFPFDNRDTVTKCIIWNNFGGVQGSSLSNLKSINHPDFPEKEKPVRAEFVNRSVYVKPLGDNKCRMYLVNLMNMKMSMGASMMGSKGAKMQEEWVKKFVKAV